MWQSTPATQALAGRAAGYPSAPGTRTVESIRSTASELTSARCSFEQIAAAGGRHRPVEVAGQRPVEDLERHGSFGHAVDSGDVLVSEVRHVTGLPKREKD